MTFISTLFILFGMACSSASVEHPVDLPRTPAPALENPTARGPSAVERKVMDLPPHVIFFIHGFRDNGSCFQDLPNILAETYRAQNIRVKALTYPSIANMDAVQKLTAYDFAKMINTQILNYLIEQGIRDRADPKIEYTHPVDLQTPYTIIAHSQGGIVSMNYLNTCLHSPIDVSRHAANRCPYLDGIKLLNQLGLEKDEAGAGLDQHLEQKYSAEPASNIRNLITMGTPFWGSPVANSADSLSFLLGYFRDSFPAVQLENLAIGSRTLSLTRVWMLNRYAHGAEEQWKEGLSWESRYPKGMRVFNFAGDLGALFDHDVNLDYEKRALQWSLKPSAYEHDLVVPAPEARVDFIYNLENSDPAKSSLRGRTQLGTAYYPLKLAHFGIFGYPDLVGINASNMATHPTLELIRKILEWNGDPEQKPALTAENLRKYYIDKLANFTSEIKLITPIGYNRRFKIERNAVHIAAAEPKAFKAIRLDGATGIWAEGQNFNAIRLKDSFYQTYYHIGRFADSEAFFPKRETMEDHFKRRPEGYRLDYKIDVPGFLTKSFSTQVMPSYTSYTEVYIQPDFPLPPMSPTSGEPLAVIRAADGQTHIFTLKDQILTMTVSKKPIAGERCFVGFVASESTRDEARNAYIDAHGPVATYNQLSLFRNFNDPEERVDYKGITGQPVEILARVATGYRDPVSGISRACTYDEIQRTTEACHGAGIDRYLITSPEIRQQDGVKSFAEISPKLGVRWVNVVNVDSPKRWPYLNQNGFGGEPDAPRDKCLKDDPFKMYLGPGFYHKRFFPDNG